MTRVPTGRLIEQLAEQARPVRPLRPPVLRALLAIALIALVAGAAIAGLGDAAQLRQRYAGREALLGLELGAMVATSVVAIIAAFIVAIPGRSRVWAAAPLPPLAAWLLLSGLGCYADAVRRGDTSAGTGDGMHCLLFILAVGAAVAPFLIWRLARARPINPLPVALLGGLGAASASALVLQFFHPFAITMIDLAVHVVAILIVIGAAGLLNRRALIGRSS